MKCILLSLQIKYTLSPVWHRRALRAKRKAVCSHGCHLCSLTTFISSAVPKSQSLIHQPIPASANCVSSISERRDVALNWNSPKPALREDALDQGEKHKRKWKTLNADKSSAQPSAAVSPFTSTTRLSQKTETSTLLQKMSIMWTRFPHTLNSWWQTDLLEFFLFPLYFSPGNIPLKTSYSFWVRGFQNRLHIGIIWRALQSPGATSRDSSGMGAAWKSRFKT